MLKSLQVPHLHHQIRVLLHLPAKTTEEEMGGKAGKSKKDKKVEQKKELLQGAGSA